MESLLRRLFEIEGVLGALLVGKDGLVIASLMESARADMHAALVARPSIRWPHIRARLAMVPPAS